MDSKRDYATVSDLIEHLKKFDPDQRLCFWDEGGAHMECVHVPDDWFKKGRMFQTVGDRKKHHREQFGTSEEELAECYEFVEDNDVIVY